MKLSGRQLRVAIAALLLAASTAAQDLVIDNVTVVDGTGGAPRPAMTVVIEAGRFAAIYPSALARATEGEKIDGSGKFLVPGLMDMHIHLKGGWEIGVGGARESGNDFAAGEAALASYLYSGVTSVYDSGNNPDFILELRRRERAGEIHSPRIFATGGIVTYPGSHGSGPGYTPVDDWPEAKAALDAHIATEPDVLKLTLEERGWGARPMIPLLPVDLMQRVIEYYGDHGIRTTVHASSELRARQAIFAGIDNLSHPVIQGPITDEFAALMGVKKVPMVSTLAIGENYSRLAEHPEHLDQPLYRAALSPSAIEELKTSRRQAYQERTWTWWMKIMTPVAQENLRRIHDAGGVVVVGTDQSIGPALHREMELLQDAGMAPSEILRAATLNGAIFLGRSDELGSIEVGKLADAVLLNADPTEDVDNLKEIELVVKTGTVVDEMQLPLDGEVEPGRRR